jgi:hypothetical protein
VNVLSYRPLPVTTGHTLASRLRRENVLGYRPVPVTTGHTLSSSRCSVNVLSYRPVHVTIGHSLPSRLFSGNVPVTAYTLRATNVAAFQERTHCWDTLLGRRTLSPTPVGAS